MLKKIKNWLEIRIGLDALIKDQLTEYRVSRNINFAYTLGVISLAAYSVQLVTGFFLLMYYVPHADHAFKSVQDIMMVVPYGWLVRMIHVVGSNLMVVAVIFHLLSVFVMGSYKKPRELTWLVGGMLLFTTFGFCLTGYLLPWSQLSYWATTIVAAIPTAFPVVGDEISKILKGGEMVSGITLNRFFAAHMALFPTLFAIILGVHLFLIRRIGISTPPFGDSGETERPWTAFRHEDHPEGFPFYPDFAVKEVFAVMVFFALTFGIMTFFPTLFLPEDANIPADPFKTPTHIRPEWYFLAPYMMIKLVPNKFLGISLQIISVTIFLLWPFIDTKDENNILRRPVLRNVFFAGLIIWVVLTVWGAR